MGAEVEDDDADGEEMLGMLSRSIAEYAHEVIKTIPLPSVYGGKPKAEDRDWMKKNRIRSRIFPFPDPLLIDPKDPHLGRFLVGSVAPWICASANLQVIDYESFYWDFLPEGGLRCHCGLKLHRKGLSPNVKLLRSLNGMDFSVVAFVLYECSV